ncbi:unnamed protein product, partial [marine sediment metagenome]
MDEKEGIAERKSQERWSLWDHWKPSVQIKKGMLVRCKARFRPVAFATTDEY